MTHYRWLKGTAGVRRSPAPASRRRLLLLPAALPQQRADRRVGAVLRRGGALALRRACSRHQFWDDIASTGATAFVYIGELCRYLLNQPPSLAIATTGEPSRQRPAAGHLGAVQDALRHRTSTSSTRAGRQHRVRQRPQPRPHRRDLPLPVTRCVRVRRRSGGRSAGRRPPGRVARGEVGLLLGRGQPSAPVRRLHRQGGEREEAAARRVRRRRLLVRHRRPARRQGLAARRSSSTASATPSAGRARTSRRTRSRPRSRAHRTSSTPCLWRRGARHRRPRGHGGDHAARGCAVRRCGGGGGPVRGAAGVCGAAVRAGGRRTQADVDVQEQEWPTQDRLRRRRREGRRSGTCWPAAPTATSSSTTPTSTRSRQGSDRGESRVADTVREAGRDRPGARVIDREPDPGLVLRPGADLRRRGSHGAARARLDEGRTSSTSAA